MISIDVTQILLEIKRQLTQKVWPRLRALVHTLESFPGDTMCTTFCLDDFHRYISLVWFFTILRVYLLIYIFIFVVVVTAPLSTNHTTWFVDQNSFSYNPLKLIYIPISSHLSDIVFFFIFSSPPLPLFLYFSFLFRLVTVVPLERNSFWQICY